MRNKDYRVIIDKLKKMGLLEKVKVQRPPGRVKELGKQKSAALFDSRSMNCADKSICFVQALREDGENNWHIVAGFAFNPECEKPHRHVWIRNGKRHYDPSWCTDWDPKDLDYYQLLFPIKEGVWISEKNIITKGNDILHMLKEFAEKWEFTLAGQLD